MGSRFRFVQFVAPVALGACSLATTQSPSVPTASTVAAQLAPQSPQSQDYSFAVELGGATIGRATEAIVPDPGGGFTTRQTAEIRIARLGAVLEMRSDVTSFESADGQLTRLRTATAMSAQETTSDVRIVGSRAMVREAAGNSTHERTVALQEPLLGPVAIRRLSAARLRAPGDTVDYAAWSAELSSPQHIRRTAMASEALVLDGVSAPTMRVKEDGDGASGPRSVWIDTAGREVRMETATPVGTMVVVARKQNGAAGAGELVSGAFEHSLIRSNVRLPRARTMPRLVVRLTPEDASQNVPDLNGPGERVLERQDGSALVEVRRGNVVDPSSSDGAEQALAPFLGSSVQIDPDDPGVRAIAHAATAGLTDEWDKALSLTRWVSQNMTFDAGILFASSSELAAGRHGTCAGYAVLLAALLRAEAIPARLAMGVVYVEGAFGGHAWVEARVHGSWLALDAALPSDGPADATHIAFARDSLEAGLGRLMMPLGRLLGHTKLAVLEYTGPDGRTVRVDERTHPWTVSGSTYVNPGLGLSLRAPAGYRFTKLDAMYPDATLVELEAPAGTVSLVEAEARTPGSDLARAAAALSLAGEGACERRVVAGRPACVSRAEGAERAAFSDGPALFVVTARASGATSLLDATVSGLRFDHAP